MDGVIPVSLVEGEFYWHKHDNDDKFFFVLEGNLFIDLGNKTIELGPNQGTTISKGVNHMEFPHPKIRQTYSMTKSTDFAIFFGANVSIRPIHQKTMLGV
ncbi:MAG: cupin domain-containing protein [Oligoflexia bacterium]|nr:cupin domain-containing protein [Oligoflexia bacterium]